MSKQEGQVVVIILLIMAVALAIGISFVGRSVTEVATSSKTENSSRAFSAAEAGLEKALQSQSAVSLSSSTFTNNAQSSVVVGDLPDSGVAAGYAGIDKQFYSVAQFWLADPGLGNQITPAYQRSSFDIYFGELNPAYTSYPNTQTPKPAVEVHVISYQPNSGYRDDYYVVDPDGTARTTSPQTQPCSSLNPPSIPVNQLSSTVSFYCKATIGGYPSGGGGFPVMARVRILYSDSAHPVALQPERGASLPKQLKIYKATGTAGNVQRDIVVNQWKDVMPYFFDYALFSRAQLRK